MKSKKIIYYHDPLNDDFAGTEIATKPLKTNFKYVHKNVFWKFSSFLLYYLLAMPILFFYAKIRCGVRVKNKKVLRKVRSQGYFLYGNHTQSIDAFTGHVMVARPKKGYVVANPDSVSIKGIGWLVMMLGTLPLPNTVEGMRHFLEAMEYRLKKQKRCIIVYPEAHIWPYYNDIRDFPNNSFRYPVKYDAPIIAMCATYRKRKINGDHHRPHMIITLSEPFYPNQNLPIKEAMSDLRDRVYSFMKRTIKENQSYAYIDYVYSPHINK